MTAPKPPTSSNAVPGASPCVLALRQELAERSMRTLATFDHADRAVEIALGRDSLWILVRRDAARLAIRTAYSPSGLRARKLRARTGEAARIALTSAIGRHTVVVSAVLDPLPLLRIITRLTPAVDLLIPHLPRDLYPLDGQDDPLGAAGSVEAAQRGLNAGLLYWRVDDPTPGSLLYLQNLSALNPYFAATRTKPDGAVGGEWPELGYLPPTPPQSETPPVHPLPKGEEVTLSDAMVVFHRDAPRDEAHSARLFLQMLGSVYRQLDRPPVEFHDWPALAERTVRDLGAAPGAVVRKHGSTYVRPYNDGEEPDAMVQMSVLAALHDHGRWQGEPHALEFELARGMRRFFDPALGMLGRYLPNAKGKDRDLVDSWYLYHPLLNLGRMALTGDGPARDLFERSLGYATRAARHFGYRWPIQFRASDFLVVQQGRDQEGLGQTDVGGLYAQVMLIAFELTGDAAHVAEARAAIDAGIGMRFELNYQANLTAWGAAACLRLWRITNEARYLDQSYVYLASFFHNSALWESEIDGARHYRTFLGVSALHDGPYMAMFECYDSFSALERYVKDSGPDLDPAARLMVTDYCRFALDRAWFYYPDALPPELLCEHPRNGRIDRDLAFPVEDLYIGGDQAGQVGQEIYGAGAALVFASRAFHDIDGAPFRLFCDHFLTKSDRTSDRALSIQLGGDPATMANLSIITTGGALPKIVVTSEPGRPHRDGRHGSGRRNFRVPANATVRVSW